MFHENYRVALFFYELIYEREILNIWKLSALMEVESWWKEEEKKLFWDVWKIFKKKNFRKLKKKILEKSCKKNNFSRKNYFSQKREIFAQKKITQKKSI